LLAIAPDFALGHNNLAYAYYLHGEYARAIEHVDRARQLGFTVHPEFLQKLEPYRNG
ncbi:MAG: tetratricopeptide repeat protein, partial [Moorella sp. (in: Bacteria)]|nr:tetratricopeptide repeat protein [Moorella sp. (in: firmicutes)]